MDLLSSTIAALESSSIDSEHICSGFAALLRQLHLHTQLEIAIPPTAAPAVDVLAAADQMTIDHLRSLAPQSWEGDEYSPFQSLSMDGGLKFPWDAWDGGLDDISTGVLPPVFGSFGGQ